MMAHRLVPALVAIAAILGVTVFGAGSARAATRSGTLGAAASASALIAVDCADDGGGPPASLTIQVSNLAPASTAFVGGQIRKVNLATNTTDPVGDDGNASPAVFVNGGAGRYDVFVDKTAAGAEAFLLTAQCWTGAGGTGSPTGTTIASTEGGPVPTGSPWSALLLGAALVAAGLVPLRMRRVRTAR